MGHFLGVQWFPLESSRMPDYEIRTKRANPPIFEAVVTVHEASAPMSYSGFSSSRADAKRQAAAKALLAVQAP
jgi:hypothetical protein